MNHIPHPATLMQQEHINIIRKNAQHAEELGMLNPEQLALVHQQNWFNLLAPQVYGGVELTLPNLVRLQEAISWADGSTGWVVTLCSGASWFGGFLNPDTACGVFANPEVCLAGSGAPNGTAEITEQGYLLNGTWKYASGAYHATHFTANYVVKKNGEAVLDDKGQPLIMPFIIDKKDVSLLPTWKYVGMVATGSHSFHIQDVHIAASRSFHIDAKQAEIAGALYQYPFLQLAEATLAVNLSGMALHFTDLCVDIFKEKLQQPRLTEANKAQLTQILNDTNKQLQLIRNEFFALVDASWHNTQEAELAAVSKVSRKLAIAARSAVDTLFPYCGLMAAAPDTEINRVWRDIHTAGQHALLTFAE